MRRVSAFVLVLALAQTSSADCCRRYVRDVKSLATAPVHWDRRAWTRFAEGTAAVAVLYVLDRETTDAVQRNRSAFSDDFADVITPFGGSRAWKISLLMLAAGSVTHHESLRAAGRDSLESEIWAAGVVTPLLKRTFGRARPIQDEGSTSFHPFNHDFQSFPSGHATNAFAAATAIAAHYDGWVVPTIVYTLASGVALSRVNDRAHFPSDVLAGALIGHAVAKGVVARHGRWTATPVVTDRAIGVVFTLK